MSDRMNGTAADLKLPNWTTRLWYPDRSAREGSGHCGADPSPSRSLPS